MCSGVQNKNGIRFTNRMSLKIDKNSDRTLPSVYNFEDLCKPARFAKEFMKMSSIRYKPAKNYTKECPIKKPVNCRRKCTYIYTFVKKPLTECDV